MTPLPFDVASLIRPIRALAWQMSRKVHSRVLDHEDLLQEGLIGALSVRAHPDLSAEERQRIHLAAARRQMIDALRCLWDSRSAEQGRRGRHNTELLADDIVRVAERRQSLQPPEEAWATFLDLQALAAQLTPRQRRILRGRLEGKSHETIGWELGRSHMSVYLHETPFRHRLREIAP